LCGKVKSGSLGFPGINLLLEGYGLHTFSRQGLRWQSAKSHRG